MENLPKDKKIILFDGVCNLCDASVQFIIKHDDKDIFRFVAIQSELGSQILKYIGVKPENIDSIILYEPGIAYYYKAEAAMRIAKELNSWHKIISYLSFTGKSFNFIYDFVAKNRYKWYGKKESCMIPTPALKSKFLYHDKYHIYVWLFEVILGNLNKLNYDTINSSAVFLG